MFAKFLSNSLKNATTDDIVQKMTDSDLKDNKADEKKQRKDKSKKKKREKAIRPKSPPLDSLKKVEQLLTQIDRCRWVVQQSLLQEMQRKIGGSR